MIEMIEMTGVGDRKVVAPDRTMVETGTAEMGDDILVDVRNDDKTAEVVAMSCLTTTNG